jgi:hypothetical protein
MLFRFRFQVPPQVAGKRPLFSWLCLSPFQPRLSWQALLDVAHLVLCYETEDVDAIALQLASLVCW